MLVPKRTKYKKHFKGLIKGRTSKGHKISFGLFALKTLEPARITSKQLEAVKRVIIKKMKKLGFLWIKVFPQTPVTYKPSGIRMGKGKGSVDNWVAKVKPGQILYEIAGVSKQTAMFAFLSGSKKLPVKTKFIEGL